MKRYLNILLISACLALTACDFRYRNVDSGASAEDIQNYMNNVLPLTGQSESLRQMYEDPNTYFYFAQWERGYEPMGPLNAVAPISWNLITGENFSETDLEKVRVYFFHKIYSDETSDDVLVLEYQIAGTSHVKYFSNVNAGEPGFSDGGVFNTLVEGTSGGLVLESYDVAEGDLDADIQLKIYDANDNTLYLGKFSNLEGFSI